MIPEIEDKFKIINWLRNQRVGYDEKFTLICYPENFSKEEFIDYGWEFLKTVEEVNEWL